MRTREKKRKPLHFHPSRIHSTLLKWYRANDRALPWRQRFSETGDPYFVWVSEIMLQQTVIKAAIPAYLRFIAKYPNLRALALEDPEKVKETVQGLGYYRRFGLMHRCAQHLVNENGGRWPGGFDELIALPGIGPYTASALSSIAFSAPHPAIDGNLERVLTRLFDLQIDPTKSKPLMKKYAYAILNEREPGDHNQALMELGQLTCRPREAHCPTCPISRFCLARARQTVHKNPKPKAPLEMRRIKLRITLVKNGSKYLFIKRPEDSKFLKGISGFLTETKGAKEHVLDGSFDKHTLKRTKGETIGQFQHSITNHQITCEVRLINVKQRGQVPKGQWLSKSLLPERLVASLDRKALAFLR